MESVVWPELCWCTQGEQLHSFNSTVVCSYKLPLHLLHSYTPTHAPNISLPTVTSGRSNGLLHLRYVCMCAVWETCQCSRRADLWFSRALALWPWGLTESEASLLLLEWSRSCHGDVWLWVFSTVGGLQILWVFWAIFLGGITLIMKYVSSHTHTQWTSSNNELVETWQHGTCGTASKEIVNRLNELFAGSRCVSSAELHLSKPSVRTHFSNSTKEVWPY